MKPKPKMTRTDYVHATAIFAIEALEVVAKRLASTKAFEEGSVPPFAIQEIRSANRLVVKAITSIQMAEEDIQAMKDAIDREGK